MKVFTQRDKFKTFVKSRIEITNLNDWVVMMVAIQHYIHYLKKNIQESNKPEYWQEQLNETQKVFDALQVQNQIPWDGKYIIKE